MTSLSLRRAWIEIVVLVAGSRFSGRSPYGERGLKCASRPHSPGTRSRSPYGERGLKSLRTVPLSMDARSLSLRRAWIEIVSPDTFRQKSESLSLRRAWIEIHSSRRIPGRLESLSLRRAWIEMRFWPVMGAFVRVALLTESVD